MKKGAIYFVKYKSSEGSGETLTMYLCKVEEQYLPEVNGKLLDIKPNQSYPDIIDKLYRNGSYQAGSSCSMQLLDDNTVSFYTAYNFSSLIGTLSTTAFVQDFSKETIKEMLIGILKEKILIFDFVQTDTFDKRILPLLSQTYSDCNYRSTNGSSMRMVIGKF